MELLTESGFEGSAEALELVASSATQAIVSLRFMRSAFGGLGDITGQADQIREIAADWLVMRSIELSWQLGAQRMALEVGRLRLNLLGIAGEVLPLGGVITLTQTATPGARCYRVQAQGPDAQVRREVTSGLDAISPEGLTPREAHAYFFRRLIQRSGGALDIEQGQDEVMLELILRR